MSGTHVKLATTHHGRTSGLIHRVYQSSMSSLLAADCCGKPKSHGGTGWSGMGWPLTRPGGILVGQPRFATVSADGATPGARIRLLSTRMSFGSTLSADIARLLVGASSLADAFAMLA